MRETIHIKASRPYDAVIGKGILKEIGPAIKACLSYPHIVILTDDNVDRLYAGTVVESLAQAGLKCHKYVFPHGEQSKGIDTLCGFISSMAECGTGRADAVIALGGGVTGDIGGLAAALYMRGIGFIQVPTTLLAMADSSVGGKTAIDIPQGKNLIGAFHQPSLVWCDTDTLATLPHDILRDGYAEVIKYGILFDREFFDGLTFESDIVRTVSASVRFKRDIVEADERDKGIRALLNLGHTVGHAIERLSDYSITHGEAVAMGILHIARIGAAYGLEDCTDAICSKLSAFGFSTECPYPADDILNAALADKKRNADSITLVLPEHIGKCGLYNVSTAVFKELLSTTER